MMLKLFQATGLPLLPYERITEFLYSIDSYEIPLLLEAKPCLVSPELLGCRSNHSFCQLYKRLSFVIVANCSSTWRRTWQAKGGKNGTKLAKNHPFLVHTPVATNTEVKWRDLARRQGDKTPAGWNTGGSVCYRSVKTESCMFAGRPPRFRFQRQYRHRSRCMSYSLKS